MKRARVIRSRDYRNKAEQKFAESARKKRWFVTKRGYPDFICYRPTGEVVLVEVKMKKSHKLSTAQYKLMNALKQYGIPCFKWSTDNDWLEKWIEPE